MIYIHVVTASGGTWTCQIDRSDEGAEIVRVERDRLLIEGVTWVDERLQPPKRIAEDPKATKGFAALATGARQQALRGGCAAGALYRIAESWERTAGMLSFAPLSQRMAANAAFARDLASLLEDTPNLSAAGLTEGFTVLAQPERSTSSLSTKALRETLLSLTGGAVAEPGETLLIWATLVLGAQRQAESTATADEARRIRWAVVVETVEAQWAVLRHLDATRSSLAVPQ